MKNFNSYYIIAFGNINPFINPVPQINLEQDFCIK